MANLASSAGTGKARRKAEVGASGATPGELAAAELLKDAKAQEEPLEHHRDKYRFLVNRLRADSRFFFHSLQEFTDLSQDAGSTRRDTKGPACAAAGEGTSKPQSQDALWKLCIAQMENDISGLCNAVLHESNPTSLDAIVTLINYRDRVIAMLLDGLLFQKAVLDADLALGRKVEELDGPMASMQEHLLKVSTPEGRPDKLILSDLPSVHEPGPFTYDKAKPSERAGSSTEASALPGRLLSALQEIRELEKGLRHIKFGTHMNVPDKHRSTGVTISTDLVRQEITKWFDRCTMREHEVQMSKAQRHTPWEVQLEQLTQKCAEKDQQNQAHMSREHKLEGDVQNLKLELTAVRREKAELAEKSQQMANENLPVLNHIDKLLGDLRESVDRLTADAEILSSMFRLQVEEYNKIINERDEVSKELNRVHRLLKSERLKNQFKEDELQKKETLYQRTVEARKSTLEQYTEQKVKISEVEEARRLQEAKWEQMLEVVQGRDSKVRQLKRELQDATQEIDGLEQQMKMCMQRFREATGRSFNMFLEHSRKASSAPPQAPPLPATAGAGAAAAPA